MFVFVRLLLLLQLFLILFCFPCTADFPCFATLTWAASGESYSYDLSALTNVEFYYHRPNNHAYWMTLCSNAPHCPSNARMCEPSSPVLAYQEPHTWSFIPGALPAYGVQLTGQGDLHYCSATSPLIGTIQIVCDTNIVGDATVEFVDEIHCTTTFRIRHAAGCLTTTPTTATPATTFTTTPLPAGNATVTIQSDRNASSDDRFGTGIGVGVVIGMSIAAGVVGVVVLLYKYRKSALSTRQGLPQAWRKLDDEIGDTQMQALTSQVTESAATA